MMRFDRKMFKYLWFLCGFLMGYTVITLGHADLPNRAPVIREIKGVKIKNPEFEQDFAALNQVEKNYAENWNQQKRLAAASRSLGARSAKVQSAAAPVTRNLKKRVRN